MQNHLRLSVVAWTVVLLVAVVPRANAIDLRAKIEPLARPLLEDGRVVGMVIGIVKDGQTQAIAYGETNQGSGITPDGDTVYEIGSASKVFTSVLLADSVQRGRVKLDDPLQKHLPATVKAPVADGTPITLEHLATHTSGLPRLPDNLNPADPSNPYADYTAQKAVAFLGGHTLRRPPGEYEYSNYGMGLLGHVLARQAGTTYEQLLIERVANPLGMHDTRITLNPDQRKRLAPPYGADLEPAKNWDFDALAGAGAIRSTVHDMLKFMQANVASDNTPLTAALRLSHVKRHSTSGGQAIGLGWHIARDGITRLHNGMTAGYHAFIAVVPDLDLGVVVLANTANMQISQFGEQVTQLALGQEVEPFKLSPKRTEVKVDAAVLASYAGVYALAPQFDLTVTVEDGKLMAQATGQPKIPVFAESKTNFFLKVVDAQITFVPDKDGKVDKLILHQNGRDIPATRKN